MAGAIPADVLRDVGPTEIDEAGEMVAKIGVHNQAERLINQVADNFPPALVAAGSRRVLGGRSQTLNLAEVADAASEAFPDFTELLSAKVRGSEERPEKIGVNVVCRSKSGRSFRGIIPYDKLNKSKRAYDEGVKNGTVVIREDDPEANRKALEEAQRRIVELETGGARAGAGQSTEPEAPPEPFPGYEDVNASDLVDRIEEGEFDLQTLFAIATSENARSRPRETVLEAVKERTDAAEAALAGEDDAGQSTEPEAPPEPYEGYGEEKAKERVAKIQSGELTLSELLAVRADQEAAGNDLQKTVLEAANEKITAAEAAIKSSD